MKQNKFFFIGIFLIVGAFVQLLRLLFFIPKVGDCEDYDWGFCVDYWSLDEVRRERLIVISISLIMGIIGCVFITFGIVGIVNMKRKSSPRDIVFSEKESRMSPQFTEISLEEKVQVTEVKLGLETPLKEQIKAEISEKKEVKPKITPSLCEFCGNELNKNEDFCPKCGIKIPRK
ncbi:MAG: zinc ribbon domain-containing protein [Promethearchaeota archaeon]